MMTIMTFMTRRTIVVARHIVPVEEGRLNRVVIANLMTDTVQEYLVVLKLGTFKTDPGLWLPSCFFSSWAMKF